MKNHRGGLPYGWRREASKEFVPASFEGTELEK